MFCFKLQPSYKTVWLIFICLCLSLIALRYVGLQKFLTPLLLMLGVLLAFDLLTVVLKPSVTANRDIAHNLPVGKWIPIGLTINNNSRRAVTLDIFDNHPETFNSEGLAYTCRVPSQQNLHFQYKTQALQRGDHVFSFVEIRHYSLLKLWKSQFKIACEDAVKVYPNFADMQYLSILAADNQLSRLGIYRNQRRGSGLEFHQLREYQQGDSVRQIDWHATSKHRKLISKEFQEERDQEIICLLDCSRRMRGLDQGKAYFDHALNAMIQLGQIIVRQGDAFGFFAFSGHERWFKPRKGFAAINSVLNNIYDLHATNAPSDYLFAAEKLMKLQKKRSLVIVVTNTRNEDNQDMMAAVHLLQRKHLVVIADLRDPIFDSIESQAINSPESARLHLESSLYLNQRRENHMRLKHEKLLVLDTSSQELPLKLIQSYFEIKRLNSL